MEVAGYYVALEGVSKFALQTASKAIMQGKLGHAFFPSPPELRLQCDKAMQPIIEAMEKARRERRERDEAAAFKPVQHSEEAKARVRAAYEKFCQSFNASGEGSEIDAMRAKYDPDLLAKIPDAPTTFTKPQIGRAA